MRMLVSRTPVSTEQPFILEQVRRHLNLEAGEDDDAVASVAWAAATEMEQFAQIALLTQTIRVVILDPGDMHRLNLPIGPATNADAASLYLDGSASTDFIFVTGNRAYFEWLPNDRNPTLRRVEIDYQAGFGGAATDIPPDLAQAIMDQAALHYDGRSPMNKKVLTNSPHMARIGARYRGVRL